MRSDFAAFILSHGRPDRVHTARSLKRAGYTGEWYVVIDDEDASAEEYKKRFGKRVIQFSKIEVASKFDEGDNFGDRRAIFYARNALREIAVERGIRYYIQLDDDYEGFYWVFNAKKEYVEKQVKNLDTVLEAMLEFYSESPFLSIAFAQSGDLIGGQNSRFVNAVKTKRKAMNTFICDVQRPFDFVGRINEDVNTYTCSQRAGAAFLTVNGIKVKQGITQRNPGGMTELYRDSGTYVKSFYSVMYAPSCVRIGAMGYVNPRLHHRVDWKSCAPLIVHERYKRMLSDSHQEETCRGR